LVPAVQAGRSEGADLQSDAGRLGSVFFGIHSDRETRTENVLELISRVFFSEGVLRFWKTDHADKLWA
jgi:hypothetical protein